MADLTCQDFVELVTDYLDGALDEDATNLFEHHLALCPGCETYLEQMKETASLLGEIPEETPLRGDAGQAVGRVPRLPSLTVRNARALGRTV